MSRLIVLLVVFAACHLASAQPEGEIRPENWPDGILLVVKDESGLVTNDSPLYFASNWTGWDPGDPAYRLTGRSDLRWQVLLPTEGRDGPVRFKFTRGSWETVEVSGELEDIVDRTLPGVPRSDAVEGKPLVFEFTIPAFVDQREGAARPETPSSGRAVDAVGVIKRLRVVGGGGAAHGVTRDLLVWLPPGYNERTNAERRYPVLYLHDGQNVFEHLPGVPGEWGADETATRLIEERVIEPTIIVGIPHTGANRIAEYVPAELGFDDLSVDGEGHVEFLCREVVPRVDAAFRTDARAQRRAVGGSSLGGLISLYAATRRPDVFGMALVESPSVYQRGRGIWQALFPADGDWPGVLFIGVGGHEGRTPEWAAEYVEQVRGLAARAQEAGGSNARVRLVIDPDAAHTESAWAARLPEALATLFPMPE